MNPFTQLLGLTLAVHLGIILLKKCGVPLNFSFPFHVATIVPKILSICIIGSVAGFAVFFTTAVVFKSVSNEYSNMHLIGYAIESLRTHYVQAGDGYAVAATTSSEEGSTTSASLLGFSSAFPSIGSHLGEISTLCIAGFLGLTHAHVRKRKLTNTHSSNKK